MAKTKKKTDWAQVRRDWAAREEPVYEALVAAKQEAETWYTTPVPLPPHEPCPICGRWFGHHYGNRGEAICMPSFGRYGSGERLKRPLPHLKAALVAATLEGVEFTFEFHKRFIKEIRNG